MFSIMKLGVVFLNDIKDILYNALKKNNNVLSILNYIIFTDCLNNTDKISLLLCSYFYNNKTTARAYLVNYYYKIKDSDKFLIEFENIYNTEYRNRMNFTDFQDFKNKVIVNEDKEKNPYSLDKFR